MSVAPEIEEKVRRSFARQSMMATLGAGIVRVSAGEVVLSAPIAPHVLQQQGLAHAALAFALGDSAAGYAALSGMPLDADVLTVEMKINLLAPAVGDRLEATGRVARAGRRLTVVTAEVAAIEGDGRRAVALLQGTMAPASAGGAGTGRGS